MMKKKILFISLFILSVVNNIQAQESNVVFNSTLLSQISKNQSVREASNRVFYQIFKEQNELYDEVKKKITQVIVIHEHIYSQLYNVNSLFKQGKQVKYISKYFVEILKNGGEMVKLSSKYPEHTIWLTKYYGDLSLKLISLKDDIEKIFLVSNAKRLMDANDRDNLIDTVYIKLTQINSMILTITSLIEFQKSRAYIYSIPNLGSWVEYDKFLIQDIIHRIKTF